MSIYRTSDMPKWNSFLTEQLLIESRLKAAMKKFPEIDEYYIKQLSNSDPSGKNAYLMWMAQALKDAGAGGAAEVLTGSSFFEVSAPFI